MKTTVDVAIRKPVGIWGPVLQSVTNIASLGGTNQTNTGDVFLPKGAEAYTYDADGNLTSDGRWTNRWDAENRLIDVTSHASGPSGSRRSLQFAYDSQGRRYSKIVSNWTGSAWTRVLHEKCLYDGWNPVGTLNGNLFTLVNNDAFNRSDKWGLSPGLTLTFPPNPDIKRFLCGGFDTASFGSWQVEQRTSQVGGSIVHDVSASFDVKYRDGKAFPLGPPTIFPDPAWWPFYEGWPISPNAARPERRSRAGVEAYAYMRAAFAASPGLQRTVGDLSSRRSRASKDSTAATPAPTPPPASAPTPTVPPTTPGAEKKAA